MFVKTIVDEDFSSYKEPGMLVAACSCDFKCCRELGQPEDMCQNYEWADEQDIEISSEEIVERYLNNYISKALIFGGLEPLLQWESVYEIISLLRDKYKCLDPIVIYTGYCEDEFWDIVMSTDFKEKLSCYPNIIVKFGRFVPDRISHYDEILGVYLASDNQYSKQLS